MKHAARRWVPVATVLLLGLWSSACGSHASFQHTPFPGIERYSEDGDFAAALDTQIVLPRQPRASVLWLDQSTQWPAPLSDGDRQRLLDDLQRALSGPPFAAVSVIPTTDPTTADSQVELLEVRSAAAHLQSDVAIIVMTNTQVAREWNPLAVT